MNLTKAFWVWASALIVLATVLAACNAETDGDRLPEEEVAPINDNIDGGDGDADADSDADTDADADTDSDADADADTGEAITAEGTGVLCDDPQNPCCVDNLIECYHDANSGFYWQALPDNTHWLDVDGGDPDPSGEVSRDSAKTYCASANFGGFTGWRVPKIDELRTLVRECDWMGSECDPADENCLSIADPDCLTYGDCASSGGECPSRPFARCYLPDEIYNAQFNTEVWTSACRMSRDGFYVWSDSPVWRRPVGEPEGEPAPHDNQVWTMTFKHGYAHPKAKHFIFHPAYPPTPGWTICMYDPSEAQ